MPGQKTDKREEKKPENRDSKIKRPVRWGHNANGKHTTPGARIAEMKRHDTVEYFVNGKLSKTTALTDYIVSGGEETTVKRGRVIQ